MLGNYKNRRKTERVFKHLERRSNRRENGSLLLKSSSSMHREPVSHVSGAFKQTLAVSLYF